MIPNLSDVTQTPALRGSPLVSFAAQLINNHNTALASIVANFSAQDDDISVTIVDMFSLTNLAFSQPQKYNLSVADKPCLTSAGLCTCPGQFVFFDELHPTRAATQLLLNLWTSTLSFSRVNQLFTFGDSLSDSGNLYLGLYSIGLEFALNNGSSLLAAQQFASSFATVGCLCSFFFFQLIDCAASTAVLQWSLLELLFDRRAVHTEAWSCAKQGNLLHSTFV